MDLDLEDKPLIGILTTSTELVVRIWDDAMTAMTGVDAADAVGKHISELVPNIESRGLLARFEYVLDFGTTEVLAPALHKYLIPCSPRKASSRFEKMRQLVTISGLTNNDTIYGLLIVVEDVTARMEHEKEIAEGLHDPDDNVRLQAAKAFANGSETIHSREARHVIEALGDKSWRVRRRLVEGLAKRSAPDAVAALLEAVRRDHFDFGMLNGALQILRATSIDTTRPLLDLLRSDDDDLRMQAALALGQHGNREVAGHLIHALRDENENVRYHVIEALGTLRVKEAVDSLITIAESRDFFLSFAALDALKQIGDRSVADRVAVLLDDELLGEAAAATLGEIGDTGSAQKIVDLLNEGKLSVKVAAEALCALFDRHAKNSAADEVADLIQRTIRPGGISALLTELDKGDMLLSEESIRVAGWISGEQIVQKLAALLENERRREVALAALVCHGEAAIPHLVEKLESEDAQTRSAAALAIGSIGSPAGVDVLITTLHSDPGIAPSVLEALGMSNRAQAFDGLIEFLSSQDASLRRAAVNTLIRFRGPKLEPRLRDLLTTQDPNLRESVIRLAGDLDTPHMRAAVISGCGDPNELVRIAALEQLRNFPGSEAIDLLSRALTDAAPKVRASAAQALGSFSDKEAIGALQHALQDEDAWVRYFAIRSLASNGGAVENRELLNELADGDPAEQVRVAAAEVIGQS